MKFSSITVAFSVAPCIAAFAPSRVSNSLPAATTTATFTAPHFNHGSDVTRRRNTPLHVFLGSNESTMDEKKANPNKKQPVSSTAAAAETKSEEVKEAPAAEAPATEPIIPETADITVDEVKALFGKWNDALATGDSSVVASRYTQSPVLLATVSDTPRTDFDSVKDYFDSFLLKEPQGKIVQGFINIGEGWASDTGIYEFTMGATGDVVKARYSFVYVKEDGEYKIQHHHSSVMPEGIVGPQEITKDEVRDLFHLWNDALATLEPNNVADRYAKKAVLLPTVSDVPRTDYDSIQDYFVNFLKLEPQGEILESNVVVGHNWAQDCGKFFVDAKYKVQNTIVLFYFSGLRMLIIYDKHSQTFTLCFNSLILIYHL